jgi:predicted ATP-grasp superfamily ATP-dependent carboligase
MSNKYHSGIRHYSPAVTVGNLSLLRALGRGKFPVIAATSVANEVVFHSIYQDSNYLIPGPTKTPDEFIQALISIGKKHKSDSPVLFYDADADLLCISRNRRELEKYYKFNMPPQNVIESLVDKSRFFGYAKQHKLPIPNTIIIKLGDEVNFEIANQFTFPAIVKPVSRVDWFDSPLSKAYGYGGKAILVTTSNQLYEIMTLAKEHNIEIIVQELIPGDESNIVSYHSYANRSGNILGEYTGRKIRTYPNKFGMSTCVEVCENAEVMDAGRKIIESTGLIGVAKIDFKQDPRTGKLYLLEINPRFNIWNYPGAIAGVNLPVIAYCDIAENNPNLNNRLEQNIKWIDAVRDKKGYKEMGSGNIFYFESWLKNLNRKTVYAIWAWDDPRPFIWMKYKNILNLGAALKRRVKKIFKPASKGLSTY